MTRVAPALPRKGSDGLLSRRRAGRTFVERLSIWRRNEDGVTALTFALGLPLVLLTMTGLLEVSFILLLGTLMASLARSPMPRSAASGCWKLSKSTPWGW